MTMDARFFEVDRHDPNNYTPNPHFENKDRAQGTLFNTQQWPRGYGPERQRRVSDVMNPPDVSKLRTSTVKGQSKEAKGQRTALRQAWGEKLADTVKRSQIPAEHLSGVNFRFGNVSRGADATYARFIGSLAGKTPEVRLPADQRLFTPSINAQDLAHEIGHHVDLTLSTPNVSTTHTGAHSNAREEATADVYALAHVPGAKPEGGYSPRTVEGLERGLAGGFLAKRQYVAQTERLGGALGPRWDNEGDVKPSETLQQQQFGGM